jgi:poly(3-hydroxybutyrate) depolymerase
MRPRVFLVFAVLAVLAPVACSSEGGSTLAGSSSGGSSSSSSAGGEPDGGGTSSSSSSSSTSSSSSSSTSSSGGTGSLSPGKTTLTITAAGQQRTVTLVVPPSVTQKKLPLVIALHGNGDTGAGFISQTTQLESLAAQRAFVLAAPDGITQTVTVGAQTVPNIDWDAYRTVAAGNIDLPLVDALRSQLVASGSVDAKRVFTYGYSQGGYLSFRYAMETAATVSCGAVLAAASPLGAQLVSQAARKVPIAMQIGTNDYGIQQARSTKTALEQGGFPLDYHEIQGAGHVPVPGDPAVPLDWCLGQSLP